MACLSDGLQPFPPEKTYERKPRRKTRKDRYDPKTAPERQEFKKRTSKAAKKPRSEKVKKRKHGKRGLEDQFTAPNVSEDRLTVRMYPHYMCMSRDS